MLKFYPDYYKNFKCIADKCKHNCCIGWEIDIDEKTAEFYKTVNGDFGKRLRCNINNEKQPYFVLGENERCPFLNNSNLCDIIINLGEENICTICKEHPRFHNELPDRIESGLGLCCEEAARIILGNTHKVRLITEGESDTQDEIIALRDKIILILQNRDYSIEERFSQVFSLFGESAEKPDIEKWIDVFLKLERLDEEWTDILTVLKKNLKNADFKAFNDYMTERQTEYEQFIGYIIYRHLANSFDIEEAKLICKFALLSYTLIYSVGAVFFARNGEFTFQNQIDICRLFSAEIEYSDRNVQKLTDLLYSI